MRKLFPIIFAAGVALLYWRLGIALAQRPADLAVYLAGSQSGDRLYDQNFHHQWMPEQGLPFTYPPFAALLFHPLSLLPLDASYLLWSALNILAISICVRLVMHRRGILITVIVTAAGSITIVVANHMVIGQINILLMLACLTDTFLVYHPQKLKRLPRGMLIGVAASIKLTPVLFVAFLLTQGKFKSAWTAVVTIAVAAIAGFLVLPNSTERYISAAGADLVSSVDVFNNFATAYNVSVSGVLAQMFSSNRNPNFILSATIASIGLALACLMGRRSWQKGAIIMGMTISLSSPISWPHHWVYAIPALAVMWDSDRRGKICSAIMLCLLLPPGPFLFALNPCIPGVNLLTNSLLGIFVTHSILVAAAFFLCWAFVDSSCSAHAVPARRSLRRLGGSLEYRTSEYGRFKR